MKTQIFSVCGLVLCYAMSLLTSPSHAAEDWLRSYNGAESLLDYPVGISTSADGASYVYGTSASIATDYDGLLLRYEWNGDIGWANLYEGGTNQPDTWAAGATGATNDVTLTGVTFGDSTDMVTARFDETGAVLWQTAFDRPDAQSWEEGTHLAIRDDGTTVAVGHYGDTSTYHGVLVVSLASDGSIEWSRTFGADPIDAHLVADAVLDAAGNVYVLGAAGDLADMTLAGFDIFLQKVERNGDLGWRVDRDTGAVDMASAIAIAADGDLIVAGQSGATVPAANLIRFDSTGSEEWSNQVGAAETKFVAIDAEVTAGGKAALLLQRTDSGGNVDILTQMYDAGGALLWERTYASPDNGFDRATGLTLDSAGSVYITGTIGTSDLNGSGVLTVKYDETGAEEWMEVFESVDLSAVESVAIERDALGSILVAAGVYPDSTEDFNVQLLSYGAATSSADDAPAGVALPARVELSASFPNPARNQASINFALPTDGPIRIELLNVDGRRIATILDDVFEAGRHNLDLPVTDLASGVYFYRMTTERERRTRKLTVTR